MKRVLNRDKTSDDERSTSVVGTIDQTLEDHAAILLLLHSGMAGSAFALTRPVTEVVVRGAWLTACANRRSARVQLGRVGQGETAFGLPRNGNTEMSVPLAVGVAPKSLFTV